MIYRIILLLITSAVLAIAAEAGESSNGGSDQIWRALLHQERFFSSISDPKFYLSSSRKPKDEKAALLEALNGPKALEVACRFPARYRYLRSLGQGPEVNLRNCPELERFLDAVPADQVYLVFASESVSRPASIMGHTLLKLKGVNNQGIEVEHAISFFTRMDDVDPVSLLFQSFITGKKGYYTLSPYHESLSYYLFSEGRNVWEFEIKMTELQKELLRLHLYELKTIEMNYFFHVFNCSTLLRDILSVANPSIHEAGHVWVTPLDLVRTLAKSGSIQSRSLAYTNQWLIKELVRQDEFSTSSLLQIPSLNEEFSPAANAEHNALLYKRYRLTKAYLGYELEKDKISRAEWSSAEHALDHYYAPLNRQFSLDYSDIEGPENTIPDTQIGIGFLNYVGENGILFNLLPISHTLTNDLTGFSYESEVKLGAIQLYLGKDSQLRLHRFDIFSVKDLQPRDPITGGLSGQLGIGYAPYLGSDGRMRSQEYLEGLLGPTWRPQSDIDLNLHLGGRYLHRETRPVSGVLETGVLLRMIWKMKFVASYGVQTQFDGRNIETIQAQHAFNFKGFSLQTSWRHDRIAHGPAENQAQVLLQKLF